MTHHPPEIVRSTLAVLFIGLLIGTSLWILRPFLFPLAWAVMIVIATWPLMLKVQRICGSRRWPAVLLMSLALLLLLVVPLSLALVTLLDNTSDLAAIPDKLKAVEFGAPPAWFDKVPVFSQQLIERWQQLSAISAQELTAKLTPHVRTVLKWVVGQVGSIGLLLVQFLLMVVLAAILYAQGEQASELVRAFARRLAGERGHAAALLSAAAIRSVAIGIVGTATIQSALGGIGLIVVGVPAPSLLIAAMFLLCIAQIGPGLVLFSTVIWLYWSGDALWGTILLVWSLLVAVSDNIVRPLLIRKGADLPMVLILAGVIGGLIAFGVIGLFLGPVMLAVTHTLLLAWIKGAETAIPIVPEEENNG
ncbi:AI-2E family transporter YdiK [Desulfobulbus sp.]|uniref:AI-2E family transporter YdiK n=1 Tax=Desulfobulbus sp. TaxID=895 RepID=UPI00286EED47|nr:AI-2E family transporter YdiK [Desulfobulbus sp.]